MKRIVLLAIAVGTLGLCFLATWGGQRDSTEVERGMVFYNGRELEPPFVFTGHGTDTLYLNGIPYAPVRRKKQTFGPPVVVTELDRQQHALSVRAGERSKAGKTFEERLKLHAEVFRDSPLVDSVKIRESDNCILIYWKDMRDYPYNFEECILPQEPPPTDSMLAVLLMEGQRHDEEFFSHVYDKGGMIIFGVDYGPIFIPATGKKMMLAMMNKLARGDTLTTEERRGSILQNRSVYRALSEQLRTGKGK